jgi:hypothetical protein
VRTTRVPARGAGHGPKTKAQARLARCLFCKERISKPKKVKVAVFSIEGCKGGVCASCGTAYVMDETGKNGGDSLLDSLAVACGGDLARATALSSDEYQVRDGIYYREMAGPGLGRPYVIPKLWFVHVGPLPENATPAPRRRRRRTRRD